MKIDRITLGQLLWFQVPKIIYVNGCLDKLKEVIEGNVAALGGIGVGIAFIQVK